MNGGYYYTFSFDTKSDAKKFDVPDADIIDYSYGDCAARELCTDPYFSRIGQTEGSQNATGYYARGRSLYVKWEVKGSGKIYEDRVDLRKRLPRNMSNSVFHFVVDGPQLYVFVVPPPNAGWDRDFWINKELRKKYQIYPDASMK
jgi:hypothetical protein